MDGTVYAPTAQQLCIGRIDNRIHIQPGDVTLLNFYFF
jgi:hypothetical protein